MKACCIWATVAGLGTLILIAGVVVGWGAGPALVKSMVHDKLDLTDPDSDGYKYFIEPPVPVKVRFTFFSVDNADKVLDEGAKPILVEKGPYVYREDMVKKDIKWSTGNESTEDPAQFLEFGQYKKYTFLSEESCDGCTENDKVRTLNMAMAGLIAKAAELGGLTGMGILAGIQLQVIDKQLDTLFPETVVGDFLFNGINTGVAKWMIEFGSTKNRLPPVFRENGFALFNGKQDTSENECYQVETSVDSWDRHTMITKWGKDNTSLTSNLATAETCPYLNDPKCSNGEKWWVYPDANGNTGENSTCNQLRGTDGHQFPPFVDPEEQKELWLFNTVPCRSIFFRYDSETDIEGINVLEYIVPLDGGNVNKTVNVCACKELSDLVNNNDTCVKQVEDDPETLDISNCAITKCYDGLQDISKCQLAPTYLSYPHFYLAEEQLQYFEGLVPDVGKHRTFLDVEPNTGMTLSLHSRIQLNVPVYNAEDLAPLVSNYEMKLLSNITTVPAFPVLWIDEGADINSDPEMVDKLKKELVTPLKALEIGKWVAIGVGLALMALGGALTVKTSCGK